MNRTEEKIVRLWEQLEPVSAYIHGIEGCAGKVFIHSDKNVNMLVREIDALLPCTADIVENMVLQNLRLTAVFWEPQHTVSSAIWDVFGYMVKEGVRGANLSQLLAGIAKNIEVDIARKVEHVPIELQVVVTNSCRGLTGILSTINTAAEPALKSAIEHVIGLCNKYASIYGVEEIKKGGYAEIFPLLEEKSERSLGREKIYREILTTLYDYLESPLEIEEKALTWLRAELPKLERVAAELAVIMGCEEEIGLLWENLRKVDVLKGNEILGFIKGLREMLRPIISEQVVRIWQKYDTRLMETPEYLLNFIPTAAMTPLNMMSGSPFNIFFVTTSERMSPTASPAEIVQTIVHEEYGHCVNFTNSAVGLAYKPRKIEIIDTKFNRPITEGIAFHREEEVYNLLAELYEHDKKSELVKFISKKQEMKKFMLCMEFVVRIWKIIRYLRAIGDVRVNKGKQSVVEFVEWASKATGLSKKLVFDQFFIFVEMPGYAPCYSMGGHSIAEIQRKKLAEGRSVIDFNTFASSRGFPPRRVYEKDLKEW